jgi:hypothetical protein
MKDQATDKIELVVSKTLTKYLFGVSKMFVLFAEILMFPIFIASASDRGIIVLPWAYHSPAGAAIASVLSMFFSLFAFIVFELQPKESWAPMRKKSWIFSSNADKWKLGSGMLVFYSFASLFHALLAL